MPHRIVRRAVAAAAALAIVSSAAAFADVLVGDSNTDLLLIQSNRDLGQVAPRAVVDTAVGFELRCNNAQHVDPGQSVRVSGGAATVPDGGSLVIEPVVIGPTPADWPADGAACAGNQPLTATTAVRITAPATPGTHVFSSFFLKATTTAGSNDAFAVSGSTAASWTLTVVSNTAPVLSLPADVMVEGDTAGGAIAAYAVSVFDAEDDPFPSAACTPAVGDLLPLGPNQVDCTVTDSGGMSDSGSFTITVVDTAPPGLAGSPGLVLSTTDPAGAVLAYDLPAAADVVDPAPVVACDAAPGALAPVGDSTVTCTATDASGNRSTTSFPVRVVLRSARWSEPVGTASPVAGNAGRTVPVKVELFVDGVEQASGSATLAVRSCAGGGDILAVGLAWRADSGRWAGHLDTTLLPGTGCYRVIALHGGQANGEFRLDLRGAETATKGPSSKH